MFAVPLLFPSLTFVVLTSTFMFSRTRIVSGSFLEAATCKAETPEPWTARTMDMGENMKRDAVQATANEFSLAGQEASSYI